MHDFITSKKIIKQRLNKCIFNEKNLKIINEILDLTKNLNNIQEFIENYIIDVKTEIFYPDKHLIYLEQYFDYWQEKGLLHYNKPESFRFDRKECMLITFIEGKFYAFSALENINEFMNKSFRLLSHGITISSLGKCLTKTSHTWEKWSAMPTLHASIQCAYMEKFYKNSKAYVTTNTSSVKGQHGSYRANKLLIKSESQLFKKEEIFKKTINNVSQNFFPINTQNCIKLGIKFYGEEFINNLIEEAI